MMLNDEDVTAHVPISIAKDFKYDFGQLKPTIETSIEVKEKTRAITQNLIYHYKDHSIRVPFKKVVL